MKSIRARSRLSLLLIVCMIAGTFSFVGGGQANAAGISFFHAINQTINRDDDPIKETITVSDIVYLPQQTAHLLIYARDVDEAQGEWDLVDWDNGITRKRLGMLSGQNNQNSTTVFTLDLADVQLSNTLEIDVTNGLGSATNWELIAYWAQLVIDGGPRDDAEITRLQPAMSAAGTATVGIDTRAIEAGDYYLEVNLIDENGFNKGIYTQVYLNAGANQPFTGSFNVTGLTPGKYTANAFLYSYDNSKTNPQDKIGLVQHVVSKAIDTRLLLDDVDFSPAGGTGNIAFTPNPFSPYTTEYQASVPYGVGTLTPAPVLPVSLPAGAQLAVQVNGGGYADVADPGSPAEIPLHVGRNTVNYKVYTPDNPDGIVYTFTIDRAPKLEDLLSNPGTGIAPAFDGDTPNPASGYRTTVANPQASIVLTPELPAGADAGTTISISVNGGTFADLPNGAVDTGDLPLEVGRNTIIVRVTSPDGHVHTDYPVYVDREPALAAPGLSEGNDDLAPAFSGDVYEYTTVVGHTGTPITLTPAVDNGEKIEIRVNSSNEADFQVVNNGVTSADLDLVAGTNVIEVRVKSPDYDNELGNVPAQEKTDLIKTYKFTVIRSPFLTDIVVKDRDLRDAFDRDVLEHNVKGNLPYSQSHINVTPITSDAPVKLEIRINDGEYAPINSGELSGNLPVRSGKNKVEIKATSINPNDQQEYSTVYTVFVVKDEPPYYAPQSQLTAGKNEDGQNLLVTDIIGRELSLSAYLLKPDGKKVDLSSFTISPSGTFTLHSIPSGKYGMVLTVKGPSGQELAGHVADIDVATTGKGTTDSRLIDPRSKVTDAKTGESLEDVTVTLYWADTEQNRSKGRTPGTAVELPALNNFAPHKNSAVQTTLVDGIFGWVPFVDGDYYFIAEKDGYISFDSRNDSRSGNFGEGSSINEGIIHIGKSLVTYNFSMNAEEVKGETGTHEPYMNGYPDGEFKPNRGLSRAELAAVLSRVLPVKANVSVDVPQLSDLVPGFWAAKSIDTALKQGWMTGYNDGTFKADRFITRAEMAQAIYNIKAAEWGKDGGNASFQDIGSHWGASAIRAIAAQGLISGDANGNFRPDDEITRAEAVTLFNKLLGRKPLEISKTAKWSDVPLHHWAYTDIMEASITHEYEIDENGSEIWAE